MMSPLNDEEVNETAEQEALDRYKKMIADGVIRQILPPESLGAIGKIGCGGDLVGVPSYGIGVGGAPTRATTLPDDPKERKRHPVASGVLDYFPDAIVALAHVSQVGNEQHNPGQPLNWARGKSSDEADTMMRHFLQRGSLDKDGIRHTAKMAWRALALLQKEIEAEKA